MPRRHCHDLTYDIDTPDYNRAQNTDSHCVKCRNYFFDLQNNLMIGKERYLSESTFCLIRKFS